MDTTSNCFRKVKAFLHVIIQVDVIIAFGGFSAPLLDPVKSEYVFQVNCKDECKYGEIVIVAYFRRYWVQI